MPFPWRCTGEIPWGSARVTTWTRTPCARKERRIRRPIRALPRRGVALARDETDLPRFPPLRAAWAKRGEVAGVWRGGRNARRTNFGAMNPRTGTRPFLPREEGRGGDFQAFLEEVRWHDRGRPVASSLDEDPCHAAKASLRAAGGMTLLWLPHRSPKRNPRETPRGQGEDVISANEPSATIVEQEDRFLDDLASLTNPEALQTSGVLSEKFWLRAALSDSSCGHA